LSLNEANSGVYNRFRSESMLGTVLKPEDVSGEVKCADLTAAVGEQLRTAPDFTW
jgi:hypothetical protein